MVALVWRWTVLSGLHWFCFSWPATDPGRIAVVILDTSLTMSANCHYPLFTSLFIIQLFFFSVAVMIRRLIVFCYLTNLPLLYMVTSTCSLLCRHYSRMYCRVPSLQILLSSLVIGSGLRLRHCCGALAHWLCLQIVIVRCNTIGFTLFTSSASHFESSLVSLLLPTVPCHYRWHYLFLTSPSKLPLLRHWIIGVLRLRRWFVSGSSLSYVIVRSLSLLRWIICIHRYFLATDLWWRSSGVEFLYPNPIDPFTRSLLLVTISSSFQWWHWVYLW